jgi:hypothetical protein
VPVYLVSKAQKYKRDKAPTKAKKTKEKPADKRCELLLKPTMKKLITKSC